MKHLSNEEIFCKRCGWAGEVIDQLCKPCREKKPYTPKGFEVSLLLQVIGIAILIAAVGLGVYFSLPNFW